MHFAFELEVNTGNTKFNAASLDLKLPCGILREVSIYFDYGCDRLIRAALFDGAIQILPTNQGGYYALDGDTAKAVLYHNLAYEYNHLTLYGWTIGTKWSHTLSIMCEVQGPDEPDLFAVLAAQVRLQNEYLELLKRMI